MRASAVIVGLLGCLTLDRGAEAAVTLTPLPFLPTGLSGDGNVVYGTSGTSLLKWTAAGGMETAGTFPQSSGATVWGVSDDGNAVSRAFSGAGVNGVLPVPFLWRPSTGIQLFEGLSWAAPFNRISGDGTTLYSDFYRLLPGPVTSVPFVARSINYDGSVVGLLGGGGVARKLVDGVQETIPVPGAIGQTRISALTSDGDIAVGTADNMIFIWEKDSVQTIPRQFAWNPWEASADGRIAVGDDGGTSGVATIMIDGQQLRIRDYLIAQGVDPASIPLLFDSARSIRNDGTRFIASGVGLPGLRQSFLITIPEPSSLALPATSAFALRRRGRRQ